MRISRSGSSLKNAVVPNEPVTVEQMQADEEGRLLLLAELGGAPVGCGVARRSHVAGRGFVAARVLVEFRRQGVGTALLLALSDHVRSIGRAELTSLSTRTIPGRSPLRGGLGARSTTGSSRSARSGSSSRSIRPAASRSRLWRGAAMSYSGPRGRSRSKASRTCPCREMSRSNARSGCVGKAGLLE